MVNIGNKILDNYRPNSIEKGGELLFKHTDALKIIDGCERSKVIIIGMDFWRQEGEDIIQINSTDYSKINAGPEASAKTIKAARELITDQLPDEADYVSFILKGSS